MGSAIGFHDRAHDGTVKSLRACQAADDAMAMKGAPAEHRQSLDKTVVALAAAISGTISGLRHVLGGPTARDVLMQAMADSGLDLSGKQK